MKIVSELTVVIRLLMHLHGADAVLDILSEIWIIIAPTNASDKFVWRYFGVNHDSSRATTLVSNYWTHSALWSESTQIVLLSDAPFRKFVLAGHRGKEILGLLSFLCFCHGLMYNMRRKRTWIQIEKSWSNWSCLCFLSWINLCWNISLFIIRASIRTNISYIEKLTVLIWTLDTWMLQDRFYLWRIHKNSSRCRRNFPLCWYPTYSCLRYKTFEACLECWFDSSSSDTASLHPNVFIIKTNQEGKINKRRLSHFDKFNLMSLLFTYRKFADIVHCYTMDP